MSSEYKAVMQNYLNAFNRSDLEGILSLFSEQARIYSPTQAKPKTPREFYPTLLERSKGTTFTLKTFFSGEEQNSAAMIFDYNKAMPDGSVTVFDCVDICSFDEDNKIAEMKIIFDTKKLGL